MEAGFSNGFKTKIIVMPAMVDRGTMGGKDLQILKELALFNAMRFR
jgi:hypothetical protein